MNIKKLTLTAFLRPLLLLEVYFHFRYWGRDAHPSSIW